MKLKNILTFLVATSSLHSWACSNKVDPNKVILFIDTNFSDLEIKTAEKAACSRGERLAVVPKNYQDYTVLINAYEKNQKAYEKCVRNSGNCAEIAETTRTSHLKLMDLSASQPKIKEQIREQLKELKASNAKIQNVTVSGHDGGGSYGGYKGDFSRDELEEVIKEFPEINDVQSLMLLGCYTGVQKEILSWKSIFPNVRMIGGYDGSAPLSDKLAGHTYLEDLLSKEKKLIQQADEKKINDFMTSNVRHFNMLSAAVYVNPVCEEENPEEENSFYYASKERGLKFQKFDASKCLTMKEELDKMSEAYGKYHSGEIEPPQDPSRGELRDLYDKARSVEHCAEMLEVDLNVSNLFNLRFYSAVKENFGRFYKDELEEAKKILSSINIDEIVKNLESEISLVEAKKIASEEELEQLEKNPKAYFAKRDKEVAELKKQYEDYSKKPGFQELFNKYNFPDDFPGIGEISKVKPEDMEKALELKNSYTKYLNKKWGNEEDKLNNEAAIDRKKKEITAHNQLLIEHKLNIEQAKSAENAWKKVWIPNQENLSKKTRKETLENLHHIDKTLTSKYLNNTQAGALEWVSKISATHLQYFANPFSWHEVTSRTEAPEHRLQSLQETIKSYSMWNTGNFSPAAGRAIRPGGLIDPGVTPIPSGGLVGGMGNGQ